MPPKVRSALPPAPMATPPDSLAEGPQEEVSQTQCALESDAPQTKKRGRPKGTASGPNTTKRRRKQAPLVKNVISKNILVHPHIVQQVLNELEKVCVEHVKTKSVFRTRFFNVKLREARDARRTLEFVPGKNLRQLCK